MLGAEYLKLDIAYYGSSVQRTLERFYKSLNKSDYNLREVIKGAFTQTRAKLNPECFKHLNKTAVDTLLSVDGFCFMLPNHRIIWCVWVHKEIQQTLEAFDRIVYKTREIVRLNRSVKRKPKPKR